MKNKKLKQNTLDTWAMIRIKKSTVKILKQFQLDHELATYDQAINLMYNMLENKK